MAEFEMVQPSRRRFLGILGGLGAVALAGCGDDKGGAAVAAGTSTTAPSVTGAAAPATTAPAATAASCVKIPQETAGPYPGDGTNGPNVLTQAGVVRSDIRSSFGSATTTAKGVPLTIALTILDKSTCKPIPGAAVYLWHCDIDGRYSMYSQGVTGENYLRGVQQADANGKLSFSSIFPGAYAGRWPHVHFEVFPSLAVATSGRNATATSQLALTEESCKLVYATVGYEQSAKNYPQTTLKSDNVFNDGVSAQTPTVSGSVAQGFSAQLNVAV